MYVLEPATVGFTLLINIHCLMFRLSIVNGLIGISLFRNANPWLSLALSCPEKNTRRVYQKPKPRIMFIMMNATVGQNRMKK